jgi:hypothetical protein
MKKIVVHNDKCLSVSCDFYQTCAKNSVTYHYKTKMKFLPVITNQNECHSNTSGKQSNLKDNNYPHKLERMYDYHLHSAKDVVEFV